MGKPVGVRVLPREPCKTRTVLVVLTRRLLISGKLIFPEKNHFSRRDDVRGGSSVIGVPPVGEHDFTSFRGQGCTAISPVRTIFRAGVAKHDVPGLISIDVAGAGFLRHMVRNIVGTVVNAGKGKHPAEHVGDILRARDRRAAGVNAPPHGLFLWRVSY